MSSLLVIYRQQRYRPKVVASRMSEAVQELQMLAAHPFFASEHWQRGQFHEIMSAFEFTYQQEEQSTAQMRIQRRYGTARLELKLPVRLFFRATLAIEDLLASPDVRSQALDLATVRQRLKQLVIIGPDAAAEVWAWNQAWGLPAEIQRPVVDFQALARRFVTAPCLSHANSTKQIFQRVWASFKAEFLPGTAAPPIVCHKFGRNWHLPVTPGTCVAARLDVEALLLSPPADIAALEEAWQNLRNLYCGNVFADIDEKFHFDKIAFTNALAPAARAPRHFPSDLPTSHCLQSSDADIHVACATHRCPLCETLFPNDAAWQQHLVSHGGFDAWRQALLAHEASQWPRPVPTATLSQHMSSYAQDFWSLMAQEGSLCAACALPSTCAHIALHDLRCDSFDLELLHKLLSARAYCERHAALCPDPRPQHFVGLPLSTLLQAGAAVPQPVRPPDADAWLLCASAQASTAWSSAAQDVTLPLPCLLCEDCSHALQGRTPRLPTCALANGNLCLPLPQELRDLTFAERLFIARGFTVRRLHALPARAAPEHRQQALSGNVISFPQAAADILRHLPRPISDATELLTVFFPAADRPDFANSKPYTVRRGHVHRALLWLQRHNPFYADILIHEENLHALPSCGVLSEFAVVNETRFHPAAALGPADAQVSASDSASGSAAMPLAAAVLDTEGEDVAPQTMWQSALSSPTEKLDLVVPHGGRPLSASELGFWVFCFPHLFPFGDGVAGGARATRLPLSTWARHLLLRGDRTDDCFPWRLDLDFLATLFSTLHRQELLRAVHAKLSSPGFAGQSAALQTLKPADFAAIAQLLGTEGGLPEALRCLAFVVFPECVAERFPFTGRGFRG